MRVKLPQRLSVYSASALALLFVSFLALPALAAYPPAGSGACDQVSDTTVTVGESITVTGTATSGTACFSPDATVDLHFLQSDHLIGTATSDSLGNFTVSGDVPSTAHAGAAAVEVRGTLNGVSQSYSTAVTVLGGSGTSTLQTTGADIALMSMWGVALIGVGWLLVRFARRRKHRAA